MKRKMLALAMAGWMVFSLTACGNGQTAPATTAAPGETATEKAADNKDTGEQETQTGEKEESDTKEAASGAVSADSFAPAKDFNIRVPFAAGGSADTIARIIGQGLQKTYGKSAVINNLTGANGAIAATDLNGAKADATELMVGGIAMFTLAPLFNKDLNLSMDDYQFVCSLVSEDQMLFVAPGNSGIEDWAGLEEYAKNNRVIYGANAPGGATHMLQTMLFGEAGIEAEAVTSDGSAKDLLAVAGGNVVCAAATSSLGAQYVEEGTLVPFHRDYIRGDSGHERESGNYSTSAFWRDACEPAAISISPAGITDMNMLLRSIRMTVCPRRCSASSDIFKGNVRAKSCMI